MTDDDEPKSAGWMRPSSDDWEFGPEVGSEDEPLENDAARYRRRLREFSRHWGWAFDLWDGFCEWCSTLWTPELAFNIGRAIFALALVLIFVAISYYALFAPTRYRRELPSVDHLMKAPAVDDEEG